MRIDAFISARYQRAIRHIGIYFLPRLRDSADLQAWKNLSRQVR